MYKISVTCVGNESHTLTAPLEVSVTEPTGKNIRKEEDPNTRISAPVVSDASNPTIPGNFSADDEIVGTWNLKYYTALINNDPDRNNMFGEGERPLKESPLGVDKFEMIFGPDGTVTQRETLNGNVTETGGIWRHGRDYNILMDSSELLHPIDYISISTSGDLTIKVSGEGNKATHLQFSRVSGM